MNISLGRFSRNKNLYELLFTISFSVPHYLFESDEPSTLLSKRKNNMYTILCFSYTHIESKDYYSHSVGPIHRIAFIRCTNVLHKFCIRYNVWAMGCYTLSK